MIEKTSKMGRLVSPMGGEFGAHNRSKIDLGVITKMILFCIDFWIDCWIDLVPSGPHLVPQTFPKQSQVCSKIDENWSINLRAVFGWMLDRFLLIFVDNIT